MSGKLAKRLNLSFVMSVLLVVVAVLGRLIPHPPNFTPINSLGLFGGARFKSKLFAYLIPITALFISDLIIGFHNTMEFVYFSFLISILLGSQLHKILGRFGRSSQVLGGVFFASTQFYLITNFGVWLKSGFYPYSFSGLIACYVAAIPFFGTMLAGDLVYAAVFFGAWELLNSFADQKQAYQYKGNA